MQVILVRWLGTGRNLFTLISVVAEHGAGERDGMIFLVLHILCSPILPISGTYGMCGQCCGTSGAVTVMKRKQGAFAFPAAQDCLPADVSSYGGPVRGFWILVVFHFVLQFNFWASRQEANDGMPILQQADSP